MPGLLFWYGAAALVGWSIWAFSGDEKKPASKDKEGGDLEGTDYDDGLKSGDDMPGKETGPEGLDCSEFPSSLPAPTGLDTGFDALPDYPIPDLEGLSWKDIMMGPMALTPASVSPVSQEAAALGAEALGSQAYCAGYTEVGQDLFAKADEIRSWVLTSVW